MTKNVLGLAFLAALLMLAPLAAADADSGNTTASERPDDAAWVEDCPPDMMCAFSDTPDEDGNVTTRGPEDCEYCRYGPDDCIDCSGMPVPADDNTTWGTDCPPGVYCMYDGAPDGDGGASGGATSSDDVTGEAAGLGGFVFIGALGLVGIALLATRRH